MARGTDMCTEAVLYAHCSIIIYCSDIVIMISYMLQYLVQTLNINNTKKYKEKPFLLIRLLILLQPATPVSRLHGPQSIGREKKHALHDS